MPILLIVDIQNDYFEGGAMPLPKASAAAVAAERVLTAFRAGGHPVVHVQHIWDDPAASFMRPGTLGVEIHPRVLPRDGEPIITKAEPNAFHNTDLEVRLERLGGRELVVMGMMTSMCVDSTVRSAQERGFEVQLVEDACAAPDLRSGELFVEADDVQAAFVAALGDGFAEIVSSDQVVERSEQPPG